MTQLALLTAASVVVFVNWPSVGTAMYSLGLCTGLYLAGKK